MTDEATSAHRLPLLSKMADDMERHGSMRSSAAAAMWTAYTTHIALTGWPLARQAVPLPIKPVLARVAGGPWLPPVAVCAWRRRAGSPASTK